MQRAQLAICAKSFSYVAALLFVLSTDQKTSENITRHHVKSNIDQVSIPAAHHKILSASELICGVCRPRERSLHPG